MPSKLTIDVQRMSKKLSELYVEKIIDKGLFRQHAQNLLDGNYKDVAIYLYKRNYLTFRYGDLSKWIKDTSLNIHQSARKSLETWLKDNEKVPLSMYVIKHNFVQYINKIKSPIKT